MYGAAILIRSMAKRRHETIVVVRFKERVLPVHAADDDVLWIAGQEISGLTRHEEDENQIMLSLYVPDRGCAERKCGSTLLSGDLVKVRFDPTF